jgi:hypothetical protein
MFSLTLMACVATKNNLTSKRIVISRSHRYIYKIQVPKGDTGITKIYGGHGQGFGVGYKDSSFIYYTNDTYIATPNYFDNYKLVGFVTPIGGLQVDTVISGQQTNGKYWKEIFQKGYYIGYKNVPKENVELFNKSLATFRQTK